MAQFITYNCKICKRLVNACISNPRRYIDKLCDVCDFQPERLNPEAINEVYSSYKDCLSTTIPKEMNKIFCGCDSPNSENK